MIAVLCPSPKVPRQSAFSLLFRAFSCFLDIYNVQGLLFLANRCCSQQTGVVLRNREKHVYSIFQKQKPVLFLNNILRQLVSFLYLLILATHFVLCPQKSQNLLPRSNQQSQISACNFINKLLMHILKIRMPDIYF